MTRVPHRIFDAGDAALFVRFTSGDRELDWRATHALAGLLDRDRPHGLLQTVATYDSVLIEFDPLRVAHDDLRTQVADLMDRLDFDWMRRRPQRLLRIPVLFGGEAGPDLDRVAAEQDMTADELVTAIVAKPLRVRCISTGGTAMTDAPRLPAQVSRLADPRLTMPAGGIHLAGRQAVVKATPAPTGWQAVGRTPLTVLDRTRTPMVGYRPGDLIQLESIRAHDWNRYAGSLIEASGDSGTSDG